MCENISTDLIPETTPVVWVAPLLIAFNLLMQSLPASAVVSLRKWISSFKQLCWGSACSGCDGIAFVFLNLQQWSKSVLNVPVRVKHVFACENAKQKRRFIAKIWSPMALFGDSICLASMKAVNLLDQAARTIPVPWTLIYFAGFVCVSRSPLNPKAAMNVGCVRDKTSKTGISFDQIFGYVRNVMPWIFIHENVYGLDSKKDGLSDTGYIVQLYWLLGYCARWRRVQAQEWGSRIRRDRLYLIAFKGTARWEALNLCEHILESCCFTAEQAGLQLEHFTRCTTAEEDEVDSGSDVYDADEGDDKEPKDLTNWQTTTMNIYEELGEKYPPTLPPASNWLLKYPPCQQYEAWISAKVYAVPIPSEDPRTRYEGNYVDLHHNIRFYLPHIKEEGEWILQTHKLPTSNPWKDFLTST